MSDPYDPQNQPLPPTDPLGSGQPGRYEEPIQAQEVGSVPPGTATHGARAFPPSPSSSAASPTFVVVPQNPNPLLRWISWFGWVGLMMCVPIIIGMSVAFKQYFDTSEGVQEKFVSGQAMGSDKIAIVNLEGAIMEGDGFVKRQIDRIRKDDDIRAIVVRINSPGGTISGSDFIYHHLTKLKQERKIPLVVSMGSLAASGGYYVAMAVGDQENSIFAEDTTTTGSIGVIIPHYDLSGLLERMDILDDSIATHPRKQLLSMTRAMSEDHRQVLTKYIDQAFSRFKDIVKSGRPKFLHNPSELDTLATGEIFSAQQAVDLGLVDKIGFVEEAVERAAELANLDPKKVRVVTYHHRDNLAGALGFQQAPSTQTWNVSGLADLAVPKAYYLLSSLPPLASSWQESP